jgi:hypothetical protein
MARSFPFGEGGSATGDLITDEGHELCGDKGQSAEGTLVPNPKQATKCKQRPQV